ncbi:MAG: PEP-CTERM sorting domain-containing protein [Proteobacteria bacterium]|nr:PEP-CTERM sorting domain-containing protein [Pseudomonadota bacterium]
MTFFNKAIGGMVGLGLFAAAMSSAQAVPSTVAGTVISNGSVTVGVMNLFDVSSDSAQGVIEFSIAGLSGPVSSAVLQVFDLGGATSLSATGVVDVFGYTGDGALSFAGDLNAGGTTSIGSFNFVDGQVAAFEVDVTAFVNTLIGSVDFIGFNLRVGSFEFVDLQGQNGSPNTNPQLVLTADNGNGDPISEPGTLALLGVGMLGVCAAVRRRNRKAA